MDEDDDSSFGAPPDSHAHAVGRALGKLLEGLSSVGQKADQEFDNLEKERRDNPQDMEVRQAAIRRKAAMASLDWVISFLQHPSIIRSYPQLLQQDISRHLIDL